MRLVRTLIDCDKQYAESVLPEELRELYDGDLHLHTPGAARPFVIANFVSTLDGVVSYEIKNNSGGSTISGSNPADRFIMGLLRASADAVMVGAGTLRDISPKSLWTPEYVYPDAKRPYAEYRINTLHKPEYPLLVIVSGSGQLELERAIFRTPAMRTVVITTLAGRDELTGRGAATLGSVEVHALNSSSGSIAPRAILQLLQSQFGVKTLLHEGGPRLFGQFLAADAVDEFFLTLSPQIAGRERDVTRPAVVQGVQFMPDSAPSFQMVSVKEHAAYLYLRYRRT
ncbi:MAG: dihydrofolate reductase family protein [Terracidiphilus sp.]|jgi:riboflavin biosynthesis pyrimidine reductase